MSGQTTQGSQTGNDSTTTQSAGRPEGLPDSFWDADKNSLKADAFAEYDSLKALKAEIDAKSAAVPKDAAEYKLDLPKDFKAPDGLKLNDKDPLVVVAREFAKDAGATQEQFSALVGKFVQQRIDQAAAMQAEMVQERAKLGADADIRIKAAGQALEARVGKDLVPYLTGEKKGAGLIIALEKLMNNGAAFTQTQPGSQEQGKIAGFEKMSFGERMSAIYASQAKS